MSEPEHVCLLGLGRVGLPMAVAIANAGHDVTGVEIDDARRGAIASGESDLDEPGLAAGVQQALASTRLEVSADAVAASVYLIAIPTPESPGEQVAALCALAEELLPKLEKGALVVLESTSAPGTTRASLAKMFTQAGFTLGEDLFLAHSPERVIPGDALAELAQNARIIGGFTPRCAARAADFYASFSRGPIHQTSLETAELTKLVENTFRDVNIALANELATLGESLGWDMSGAMELANTHPRVGLHHPGAGVGGACLPLATRMIAGFGNLDSAPRATLLEAAREVNASTPEALAKKILANLPYGATVAMLGVAYKGNIADTSETPAKALLGALLAGGATVKVHDPYVEAWPEAHLLPLEQALEQADAAVLVTPHERFRALEPSDLTAMRGRSLFDLCNILDAERWTKEGFALSSRGRPWPDAHASQSVRTAP